MGHTYRVHFCCLAFFVLFLEVGVDMWRRKKKCRKRSKNNINSGETSV